MATLDEHHLENVASLCSLFKQCLDLYNKVNTSEESTNSPSFQDNVKSAIALLQDCTHLVSYAGMFSRNEEIEEVSTNDLQYLLLPALLGSLTLKLTTGDRKNIVEMAETYFRDFLSRCYDYNLCEDRSNEQKTTMPSSQSQIDQIIAMSAARDSKIRRFREQKDLELKLNNLKKVVEMEHADEDTKRDYFLTMIKKFINQALEEINSIQMEKSILERMGTMKRDLPEAAPPKVPPLQPIIITKDEIQKAVYGAGYPSMPTMTVQEFYDKRVRDGVFPDPDKKPSGSLSMQQAALAGVSLSNEDREAEEREKRVEDDDAELLERMRNMDNFKDEHRRGWGNRMNRS